MENKCMLNVSVGGAHTYLWYALKFAVLDCVQYQKWYYSNFIIPVIYAYKGKNTYKIDYCEYFDEMNVFNDVLEIELYTSENCVRTNIAEYFKRCLRENKYIEVEVDFFYIKGYKDGHFTHPILIYGYEYEVYYVLGFNNKKIFTTFALSENELIQAYQSALSINYSTKNVIDKYAYHLLKKRSEVKKFNKINFVEQLRLYCEGADIVNTLEKFPNGMNEAGRIITGEKAILHLLNEAIYGTELNIDYRVFHFLSEHKLKLLESIKFWRSDLRINNNLIESFRDISMQYEALRLRILRDKVRNQKKSKDIFTCKEYLYKCLRYIDWLIDEERELLEGILMNNS